MPKHKERQLSDNLNEKNNTGVSRMGDCAGKGYFCPFTLPETNSSTLKIDPLEKEIPIGHPTISRCYVSFTECFMTFYHITTPHTLNNTPPAAIFPKIPGTSCTTLPRRSNSMMRMRCKGRTRRNTFGAAFLSDESPVGRLSENHPFSRIPWGRVERYILPSTWIRWFFIVNVSNFWPVHGSAMRNRFLQTDHPSW